MGAGGFRSRPAGPWYPGVRVRGRLFSKRPAGADDGNIRRDSIYLCQKLERDSQEKCAHTIVHELAHFVGSPQTFDPIGDHETGYGWYDTACMQNLTPEEKVSNADNYANFAFDLKYGRPPFLTQF